MEQGQIRADKNVDLTDVPTLVRRIQRLAITAIAIAALMVVTVILGAESKVSTESVVRALDGDKSSFMAGLEEAVEFSDIEGVAFILDWTKRKHGLRSAEVVAELPSCRLPAYRVGSFDVCWSIGSTVSASTQLRGGSYLVVETPMKIFTNTVVGPAIALFLVVLGTFIGILIVGIRRLGMAIHKPIMQLAAAAANGDTISVKTPLREINALVRALEKLKDAEQYRAIAATTQMLAHDVRKPFSTMRAGLTVIAKASSPERVQSLASRLVPEVEAAIKSVNGMLADILEVGANSTAPIYDVVDPAKILRGSLEEVLRANLKAEVVIESDLRHDRMIRVDALKMQRVFQNILENAVQAMGGHGRIWVRTAMVGSAPTKVAIRLGNTGSHIAAEDLPRLFDVFFTKNKRGGTGLGLAIVKKIVEQHGGSIVCRSESGWGVEFTIELPAAVETLGAPVSALPERSPDYRYTTSELKDVSDMSQASSAEAIIRLLEGRSAPLKILAVDDESIYLEHLRQIIAEDNRLAGRVELATVANAEMALSRTEAWRPDVAVVAVDLGDHMSDGYELSQRLLTMHPNLQVCDHSDRVSVQDGAAATAAGACAFVPKPMTVVKLCLFCKQYRVDKVTE